MTSAEFSELYPRPWKWVIEKTSGRLVATNGKKILRIYLDNPKGVPQAEYNRHVVAALTEQTFLAVTEEPQIKFP